VVLEPLVKWSEGELFFKEKFLQKFISTFSQIIFFVLPLSIFFFLLRAQIVRIILGTGQFSWQDTRLTAACLGIFSLSIFAQSLIPLFARAFYALQDTRTPVKIGILSIVFNIVFSIFFVWLLSSLNLFYYFFQSFLKLEGITQISVIGLPLAFSAASMLNFAWLFLIFKKRAGNAYLKFTPNRNFISSFGIGNSFLRCFLLSLVCGSIVFGLLRLFVLIFDLQTFFGIFCQAVFAGGFGFIFYIYVAKILNFPEYKLIFNSVLSTKTSPKDKVWVATTVNHWRVHGCPQLFSSSGQNPYRAHKALCARCKNLQPAQVFPLENLGRNNF